MIWSEAVLCKPSKKCIFSKESIIREGDRKLTSKFTLKRWTLEYFKIIPPQNQISGDENSEKESFLKWDQYSKSVPSIFTFWLVTEGNSKSKFNLDRRTLFLNFLGLSLTPVRLLFTFWFFLLHSFTSIYCTARLDKYW